ncbi:MAG: methyltransferase domain-containing protein [Methyloglobulus sp.]|nr:methyltransferase domain-containing protein [Methyloglobulus sp.]
MEGNALFSDPRFIETASLIETLLTPNSKVIEVGSNDASFKEYLRQSNNLNWVTVDKFGHPDIRIDLNGRETSLPFDDHSIDMIICTEVLEHLSLGSYLVKEISRVLKKDGSGIISVPNIVSLKSRVRVLLGMLPGNAASGDCGVTLGGTGYLVDGEWVGGHVVDFHADLLFKYLERGGLKVVRRHNLSLAIRYKGKLMFKVNPKLVPVNLSDYIFAIVQPK